MKSGGSLLRERRFSLQQIHLNVYQFAISATSKICFHNLLIADVLQISGEDTYTLHPARGHRLLIIYTTVMLAGALDHLSMFTLETSSKAKSSWEPLVSLSSGLDGAADLNGARNDWPGNKNPAWDWEILELFQDRGGDSYERINGWEREIGEGGDLSGDIVYKLNTKPMAKERSAPPHEGPIPDAPSLEMQDVASCGHDILYAPSASLKVKSNIDATKQPEVYIPDRQVFQAHLKKDLLDLRGGNRNIVENFENKQALNGAQSCKGNSHNIGLKLGNCPMGISASAASLSTKKKRSASSTSQVPRCQVDTCKVDLSKERDYHRRHKVCPVHSKSSRITAGGIEQRFCQQCSRFHVLSEFDEEKRSCRRRLAGHNERRRKPQPAYKLVAPPAVTCFQSDIFQRTLGDHYLLQQQKSFSSSSALFDTYYNDWALGKTKVGDKMDHSSLALELNPDYKWLMLLQPRINPGTMRDLDNNQISPHPHHMDQATPIFSRQLGTPDMQAKAALHSRMPSATSNSGCALSLLSSQPWGTKAPNSLSLELLPQSRMPYQSLSSKNQDNPIHGLRNFFVSNDKLHSNGHNSPETVKTSGGMNPGAINSVFGEQNNHLIVFPDYSPSLGDHSAFSFQQRRQFGSLQQISENSNSLHVQPVAELIPTSLAGPNQDCHGVLPVASSPVPGHFEEYQPLRVFGQTCLWPSDLKERPLNFLS